MDNKFSYEIYFSNNCVLHTMYVCTYLSNITTKDKLSYKLIIDERVDPPPLISQEYAELVLNIP